MESLKTLDENATATEWGLPASIRTLDQRLKKFRTALSFQKGLEFRPGPEDVILSTGKKCGTTWTQQILHGLRSGGDMDFEDMEDVFPLIDFHHDITKGEGSLYDKQPFGPPQFYKSHLLFDVTPKGTGKYIVVNRDPKDAAVSFYHYYLNWFFTADEVSLDEFVEWMVVRDRPAGTASANAYQMQHLISWYPHRRDANVLWLHYEDLKADLSQCIKLLSDFIGVGVGDQELLDLVEKQSSIEFMAKHRSKFSAWTLRRARNEAMGLSPEAGIKNNAGLVRNGRLNEGAKTLSTEMNEQIDRKWRELVAPVTGYKSYAEMRSTVNKELGRRFGRVIL